MTLWVSVLLLFVSALAVATFQLLSASKWEPKLLRARVEEVAGMSESAKALLHRLQLDPTPAADSLHDPVWGYLRTMSAAGRRASMEDLSSNGGDYRFANINLVGFGELTSLLVRHGVQPTRAALAVDLLARRRSNGSHTSLSELEPLLGNEFAQVRPLLTTEPTVNVNLARADVIRDLLRRRLRFAEDVSTVALLLSKLLELRRATEIDEGGLRGFLRHTTAEPGLFDELGVKTWWWKIVISRDHLRLSKLVARVAVDFGSEYRVVGSWLDDAAPDGTDQALGVRHDDRS